MPGIRSLLLALALLIGLTTSVQAQATTPTLAPGARVRVQQGDQTVIGTLVSLDSAGLLIATGKSDTVMAPRASITAVEVSGGTKSRAGEGALVGLGVGAGTGILIGLAASGSDNGDFIDFNPGEWAVGAGLIGAAIGTAFGALIGATQQSDKWQPTVLPTVGIRSYGPDNQRVAIGLRIRF